VFTTPNTQQRRQQVVLCGGPYLTGPRLPSDGELIKAAHDAVGRASANLVRPTARQRRAPSEDRPRRHTHHSHHTCPVVPGSSAYGRRTPPHRHGLTPVRERRAADFALYLRNLLPARPYTPVTAAAEVRFV